MNEIEATVALNLLPRIGPVRVQRLIDAFGSAAAVLGAPEGKLLRVDGIGPETAKILNRWQDHADPSSEIQKAASRGIKILTRSDADYPASLREAYDAPLLLYVWGKLEPRDVHAIGVVGSRRATHYGRQATKKLTYQLAAAGFTIVSGLARGIDTAAHEAALAAPEGRTIAVIGSGLGQLYPPENLPLAQKIADGRGAVISEFPIDTAPDKQTFPMRNRIVAALSRALLVTESPEWSGSLITANLASEYGRPIYAVPGPIDKPTYGGCHKLIRDGATLVTDGSHILDDLGDLPFSSSQAVAPAAHAASAMTDLPPEESTILAACSQDEQTVDRIIEATGLPPQTVTATLMKLEIRGLVRAYPGFRYALRS